MIERMFDDEPAAPARTEAERNTHRRGCVCVRCEAEQAVLDAMRAVKIVQSPDGPALILTADDHDRLGMGELARRGLKP